MSLPSKSPDDNVLAFALSFLAAELQRGKTEPVRPLLKLLFSEAKQVAEGEMMGEDQPLARH